MSQKADVIIVAPGMRCDVVIDAVGRAGERYEVQDVFYPREQYVLMELAYEAGPPLTGLPAPVAPSAGNPQPKPDPQKATTHEIAFWGRDDGQPAPGLLDGKPTDMHGLLRRGKAWAINGHVSDSHHMDPMLRLTLGRTGAPMSFACGTTLPGTTRSICVGMPSACCGATGVRPDTGSGSGLSGR